RARAGVAGSRQQEYAGCQWYEMPHRPSPLLLTQNPAETATGRPGKSSGPAGDQHLYATADNSKGSALKTPKGF
ncbi:MAG: hypothetical protein WB713_11605, partial [Methyloceanibacter sp.]